MLQTLIDQKTVKPGNWSSLTVFFVVSTVKDGVIISQNKGNVNNTFKFSRSSLLNSPVLHCRRLDISDDCGYNCYHGYLHEHLKEVNFGMKNLFSPLREADKITLILVGYWGA